MRARPAIPSGVVQVQIQQHAVRALRGDRLLGLGHRLGPHHPDVDTGVRDQLLDEDRVGAIVLDEEKRQRPAVTRSAHVPRRFQSRSTARARMFD